MGNEREPWAALFPRKERHLELVLLVVFFVGWLAAMLVLVAGVPLAGTFELGLYHLYIAAAVLGWLCGNVYVHRSRGLPRLLRRRLLLIYLLGPPGFLYLLWSTAPLSMQRTVPLASVYSCFVFGVLFLVPVSFARWGAGDGRPRR